jgi:Domain of unknown function (DUF4383)
MIKRLAVVFGAVLVVIGILGFISGFTPSGMLFGAFAVDPMHNTVHIITGVIALIVGLSSERASITYFQVFGVLYALLAIAGFMRGNMPVMGMANNTADAGLHLLIALVTLFIGFVMPHRHWHLPHWRWRHH